MRGFCLLVLAVLARTTTSTEEIQPFRCGQGDTCQLSDGILKVFELSAKSCRDELNTTYGNEFEKCTSKRMVTPFPSDEMKRHMFRNFTCDEDYDKSPIPLATIQLEYKPSINEFYMNSRGKYRMLSFRKPSPKIHPLKITYGMSIQDAKESCDSTSTCFCFSILHSNTLSTPSSSLLSSPGDKKQILLAGMTLFYTLEPFLFMKTSWYVDLNISIVTYVKTQFRYKDFIHFTGYIHRGNTLTPKQRGTNLKEILTKCESDENCGGLTFKGNDLSSVQVELKKAVNMKQSAHIDWHSFIHIRSYGKLDENKMLQMKTYDVDVYAMSLVLSFSPSCSIYTHTHTHKRRYRETPMVIAIVRNFGTREECEQIQYQKASAGWRYAKVSDAKSADGAKKDYRRQAKSKIHKQPIFDFSNPLSKFFVRNFAIVHGLTGHNVWPAGQEPLSVIKYNVSGDEFRPHCDGDCTSTKTISKGNRVATSILYCKHAERGGHTHFNNAKIKLKPKQGDLLVFSYVYPDNTNDYMRLSEHSGCPIKEGEKIIATQWFRRDVYEFEDWVKFRKVNFSSEKK